MQEDDDDAAKSATGGFEEDDDDGGVVAEAYVQLGSYHSAKNLKLVVDEQNADDRHSTNDDAGEDAA
jgi:hypothetical protein